ncbi:pre-mRNA-splicing factor slt11 [Rhizodiscina lignyota]|uniref:Pre-mRNA-splicing factor slt11 n=1 Tax=Rhizodiscina lignyota TaxID=1504668 RepID=A0A9P4M4T7_9PEZI|nr:pre-mRNA-splicing factor slt11 [Rhizodiscina lignyota]
MPPVNAIKHDVNRSGKESQDFPSVCENCLPDANFVQMLKEEYGAECKICSRPFTIFRWKADRTARQKRTNICLTCARLKNCCQCCMLDLSYGLPITVRDAALKMVAPGPQSEVNREYYAQEHEKAIEEGRGPMEAYEKTEEKARELLTRLANSEPYYKKQRRLELEAEEKGEPVQKALPAPGGDKHTPGPIRPRDSRYGTASAMRGSSSGARGGRGGKRGGKVFPSATQLPPQPQDILPPADKQIMSLFVTGVEDDQPEHEIRTFFSQFGNIRSLVCSHRSHCAFINYNTRKGAEAAAEACQGRAVVKGVPLRVQWGRPKTLDTMDRDIRLEYARSGRNTAQAAKAAQLPAAVGSSAANQITDAPQDEDLDSLANIAAPPGSEDVNYASLAGN